MLDKITDILNRNVMLPDRLMYLSRHLRDAQTFEDASNLFGIAEQILSDALDDFNDLYSGKIKELNQQGS